MAMVKMCRCGKLIDYNLKSCEDCEEIYSKDNKARHSSYNRYQRDADTQKVYNDPRWNISKERAGYRDNYLCMICLEDKTIKTSQAVHHIVELKESISKAFQLSNLICVCESCHQTVHSKYKQSNSMKVETQNLLLELIVEGIKI